MRRAICSTWVEKCVWMSRTFGTQRLLPTAQKRCCTLDRITVRHDGTEEVALLVLVAAHGRLESRLNPAFFRLVTGGRLRHAKELYCETSSPIPNVECIYAQHATKGDENENAIRLTGS